ncbi:GGDEF/EAL domain-containing response regulator [Aestuariirhabdus litorea]|uniref:cyclic-guanylate-specific phosphodiesterase n=1 Tax=Aestuariirhabdus litorea TaxID=2528527 RepID=A0A3P3VQ22_9GAMM|nr:EAL domain-containing protein [Aestuariirhabdus litorea]RRJ84544.1 EAL domain-containing protein [Aestuariirhabdus litorea]RWW97770.1 EAL domain-containing protein [Endozoicomonadaceae bacterium GTF-13]
MTANDDLLVFMDEGEPAPTGNGNPPWKILVVDDEQQMHQATRFALADFSFSDRPLKIISAYTAREARSIIESEPDLACIFLDVVMESEDAGLKLIPVIREEMHNHAVRIILRTGQPGYAPEVEVIQRYDINDYKAKSELTQTRLFTALTSALRCYQQIRTIEAGREGLEMIVQSSSDLFAYRAVKQFASGVLTQICSLLHIQAEGVICAHTNTLLHLSRMNILAAAGQYSELVGQPLGTVGNSQLSKDIELVLQQKQSLYLDDRTVLYLQLPSRDEIAVHISTRTPLQDIDRQLLEVFCINITIGFDNAQMFERIESLAFKDQLTNLPNRVSFLKRIEDKLLHSSQQFMIIIADIDNFQAVNDGLGGDIGNETLRTIGRMLNSCCPTNEILARLGGDLFGLIVPYRSEQQVEQVLESILGKFIEPVTIEKNHIPISLSLGVSRAPRDGVSAELLFREAGIALKHSKRKHRGGYTLFSEEMTLKLRTRLETINELRSAIDNDELYLLFQPQVNLSSGRLEGVEALIRWCKPDGTQVYPTDFIPAAEDSGLIVQIGLWVLNHACLQQVAWKQTATGPIRMAVNVSMRQFQEPNFVESVITTVQQTGITPSDLELELTESIIMSDSRVLSHKLNQLREAGIQIAIDDFGTGYSSLSYLQSLPLDRLKIDRAFIENIDSRAEDASIAAMIVAMGHELKLSVLAEGVETPAHEAVLKKLGCDEAQGYYYAKPLPAKEILSFKVPG